MINQAEISKLAHKLGLGDKTIEKDYILTWVLIALADLPLRNALVFKGGTAIKKIYIPDYRFSEDLDFTLIDKSISNMILQDTLEHISDYLKKQANISVAFFKTEEHMGGNTTIYINYAGPLQAIITSRSLKIDFSRDEDLVLPVPERRILSTYSDSKQNIATIPVYSLEEILIEKLRSLLTRTEPRDLFDIHYLLINRLVDVEKASFYAAPKFTAKGFSIDDLGDILERRKATLQQLWEKRLEGQMPSIPDLNDVIRETNRVIHRYFPHG
jgi:uncharacterized protein